MLKAKSLGGQQILKFDGGEGLQLVLNTYISLWAASDCLTFLWRVILFSLQVVRFKADPSIISNSSVHISRLSSNKIFFNYDLFVLYLSNNVMETDILILFSRNISSDHSCLSSAF